jgi:threonine dehydrogenase-like Zn-dependent dehydrogenase
MRALVFDQGIRYDPRFPEPAPPPGEALVRVRLAGICNTDLELVQGYLNFRGVLGHEFVGDVVQSSDAVWTGVRVVGDINAACCVCDTCRAGRHTHCPNRTTLGISGRDGAFADYLLLPTANLYAVPPSLPDERAVFVEPLAAACEVLEQANVRPTDRVFILGDGKLGLLVAAVMRLTGADLTVLGRHVSKLSIAEGWGIRVHHIEREATGGEEPPSASLQRELGRADCVVECTGSPTGFAEALQLLRPGGTLVLKSTYHGKLSVNMSELVVNEITLLGSRCGPFAPALRLLECGLVDPTPLIAEVFRLSEGQAALDYAARKGVLKVLLRPDGPEALS